MVVGDLLSIFLDGLGFLLSQFNKIDIFIEEIYGNLISVIPLQRSDCQNS